MPRYIGRTKDADSFHRRIQRRHVTGTEEPSHRFAYAYNVGRMWRRKGSGGSDAKVAKALRTSFIRQYCRVVVHTVLPEYFDMLPSLEGAVFDLVPAGALSWSHGTSIVRIPEPTDLVGRLLDEMSFPEDLRQAVERQARLYASS
ncbi:MAG: hypothetical protein EOP94_04880 [Zymomonas sp.]|nr:MAG: hypothetical protein EOP94_04880 [Zymomonas sp.]